MTDDKDSAVLIELREAIREAGVKRTTPRLYAAVMAFDATWNARQPTQSDVQLIANERKAIAAWLRGEVDTDYTDPEYDIGRNLADAVERGAYIQEQSK
jgi:hypothetical protein